jgi:tetratricopeptide (TPR) repeat protein
MADSKALPKVKRVDKRTSTLTWVVLGAFIVVLAVFIGLLLNGTIFSSQPKSDAERDYEVLLQGLKQKPNDPVLLMTVAEIEYELGRKGDAWAHADKALKKGAGTAGLQLRYAALKIKDDKIDDALKAVQREIVIDEKSAEALFLLSQLLAEKKDYDGAIKAMDKALVMQPQAADMRIVYGEILEKADKKKRAIAQYKEALKYLPNSPQAVEGLKRLGAEVPTSTPSPHAP